MKKNTSFIIFAALAMITTLFSCESGNGRNNGALPKDAEEFLATHFPQKEVKEITETKMQMDYVVILDDGTESNETRLGAVKDIQFAIDSLNLQEDLLVIAGDNLLNFSLVDYIAYQKKKDSTCVMRYYEPDINKLRKTGVAEVDAEDRIVSMVEKPAEPKSHWCTPPFYIYKASDVPLVKKGIESGCGVDAPGSFIAWLATQTSVYAYEMPGRRFDIGNLESYQEVQQTYKGIEK